VQNLNDESGPTGARILFQFPERDGFAAAKFYWHEGIDGNRNKYLPKPDLFHGKKPSDSGSLLVGEKGILYSPNDYGAAFRLLPEKEFTDYKKPTPTA
jgi:hypothetical protein